MLWVACPGPAALRTGTAASGTASSCGTLATGRRATGLGNGVTLCCGVSTTCSSLSSSLTSSGGASLPGIRASNAFALARGSVSLQEALSLAASIGSRSLGNWNARTPCELGRTPGVLPLGRDAGDQVSTLCIADISSPDSSLLVAATTIGEGDRDRGDADALLARGEGDVRAQRAGDNGGACGEVGDTGTELPVLSESPAGVMCMAGTVLFRVSMATEW